MTDTSSSDDIDCGDWLLYVVSPILADTSLIYLSCSALRWSRPVPAVVEELFMDG